MAVAVGVGVGVAMAVGAGVGVAGWSPVSGVEGQGVGWRGGVRG